MLVTPAGSKICAYYRGFLYCVLNLEGLLREVQLYISLN